MKKLIALSLLLISACDRTETRNITNSYQIPVELSGCKVFKMSSETNKNLWVTVCGKSINTQWDESESCGKNCTRQVPYSVSTNDFRN